MLGYILFLVAFKFGNIDETIPSVLGKNHCEKSIQW